MAKPGLVAVKLGRETRKADSVNLAKAEPNTQISPAVCLVRNVLDFLAAHVLLLKLGSFIVSNHVRAVKSKEALFTFCARED